MFPEHVVLIEGMTFTRKTYFIACSKYSPLFVTQSCIRSMSSETHLGVGVMIWNQDNRLIVVLDNQINQSLMMPSPVHKVDEVVLKNCYEIFCLTWSSTVMMQLDSMQIRFCSLSSKYCQIKRITNMFFSSYWFSFDRCYWTVLNHDYNDKSMFRLL